MTYKCCKFCGRGIKFGGVMIEEGKKASYAHKGCFRSHLGRAMGFTERILNLVRRHKVDVNWRLKVLNY